MPSVQFPEGLVLVEIPQLEEDLAFGTEALMRDCGDKVGDVVSSDKMASSAFVIWQGEDGRKGDSSPTSRRRAFIGRKADEDGKSALFRFVFAEGRRAHVFGRQGRVPSLLSLPGHAQILLLSA